MKFADLFTPPAHQTPANTSLRRVRRGENLTLTSREKMRVRVYDTHVLPIGKESESCPSAPSAPLDRPPLVPLEAPFIEGKRYQLAPATEWPSRLDLYHEDPTGNTLRKHGVLLTAPHCP